MQLEFDLTERDPYGLKDERVRRLVVTSMQSGNTGAAGVFSTPMRSMANFNALVAAVKPDLGKVRQPALIVHPRDDDIASLKNAQYLQANLGGLVDTLVLDDSYHMVTLDQQRHIVAERTHQLRQAGWRRRPPPGASGRRRSAPARQWNDAGDQRGDAEASSADWPVRSDRAARSTASR